MQIKLVEDGQNQGGMAEIKVKARSYKVGTKLFRGSVLSGVKMNVVKEVNSHNIPHQHLFSFSKVGQVKPSIYHIYVQDCICIIIIRH